MFKKIFSLIAVIECIFLFQLVSPAQSSPVFGPKKYIREKDNPEKFKESFNLCATTGEYKLIVDNGYHGTAQIKINGRELIEEDTFRNGLASIERAITLSQGEHRIDIEVKGKPGAFITVSIECLNGCLEPKITFPSIGSIINNSDAVVLGSLSNLNGEGGITIQSSGVNGQVSGLAQTQGINFASIVPLQQGQNTITAIATDACGYKATDTITIRTKEIQEPTRLTASLSGGTRK
ncbi:MAG: hypothetical protein HZA00_02510 [Nitrospinae bacterium]|nr:hypothetical protein [Nitrospinota bacterium]